MIGLNIEILEDKMVILEATFVNSRLDRFYIKPDEMSDFNCKPWIYILDLTWGKQAKTKLNFEKAEKTTENTMKQGSNLFKSLCRDRRVFNF